MKSLLQLIMGDRASAAVTDDLRGIGPGVRAWPRVVAAGLAVHGTSRHRALPTEGLPTEGLSRVVLAPIHACEGLACKLAWKRLASIYVSLGLGLEASHQALASHQSASSGLGPLRLNVHQGVVRVVGERVAVVGKAGHTWICKKDNASYQEPRYGA